MKKPMTLENSNDTLTILPSHHLSKRGPQNSEMDFTVTSHAYRLSLFFQNMVLFMEHLSLFKKILFLMVMFCTTGAHSQDLVVGEIVKTFWEEARAVRRVGLEIEIQAPPRPKANDLQKIDNLGFFLAHTFGGRVVVNHHAFHNKGPIPVVDELRFHCQAHTQTSSQIHFVLERQIILPLNGAPVIEPRAYCLSALTGDFPHNDILETTCLANGQEAWDMALSLCFQGLGHGDLTTPAQTPQSPIRLNFPVEPQSPLQPPAFHLDLRYVKLGAPLTSAGENLFTFNIYDPLVGETFTHWPPLFVYHATKHLSLRSPTMEQPIRWQWDDRSDTPIPLYQHIQRAVAQEAPFYTLPQPRLLEISGTPLGTLRVMMDGTNLELITEPLYVDQGVLENTKRLFQILAAGGYEGTETSSPWFTGFHVNVEVLPQERAHLEFLLPWALEWNAQRSAIYDYFQPKLTRRRYIGAIPSSVIEDWQHYLPAGQIERCFSGLYLVDINPHHLLTHTLYESNAPLQHNGFVWPHTSARPALEYRIFNTDLSPLGQELMLEAIAFATAFTHRWAHRGSGHPINPKLSSTINSIKGN